ncbi:MAG: hypothetical protein CMJ44_15455 [Pimelobacter sp.]|nr:hypothetical protein [Pimelobacter sp.]
MSDEDGLGAANSTDEYFEVHPSVLFKLGEDLITDDAQALVELVKNSYDADAQTVRVEIDTEHWYDRESGKQLEDGKSAPAGGVRGRLTVQDDGHGMDLDAIRRGWLTVSNSSKRKLKAAGYTTPRGRTPLGDKGLGRLGVQRLGQVVQLSTVSTAEDPPHSYGVMIDWARFLGAESLNSVALPVLSRVADGLRPGTEISVFGLNSLDYWEGKGELDLQKQLASILSPYDNAAGLRVFIKINGAEIDTRREARRLLDAAPTLLRFSYAAGELQIESETQILSLRGKSSEQGAAYRRLVVPDNGFAFASWLLQEKSARARSVGAEVGDDKYFMRFHRTVTLDDAGDPRHEVGDPGPFAGEISTFTYDTSDESALDTMSELRSFAKGMSGIRVFRDGFGIRLDDDWLGLSRQQTTASSWYGLRPLNSAGYVNLSARDNVALEETSSREAFRDTPAWRGFYDLMQQVVKFARETQDLVRRNWLTYVREQTTPTDLDPTASPLEISEHIADRAAQATSAKERAEGAKATLGELDTIVANLDASAQGSADALWVDPALQMAVERASEEIRAAQSKLSSALEDVDSVLDMIRDLRGAAELLHEKIAVADERVSDAWESVALGLSAEILAHEVDHIADRLRGRSHQILDYMRNQEPNDLRSIAYAEHVRASAAELARQVSRLNPALRFRRETKALHKVSDLIAGAVDFHEPRLKAGGISIIATISQDFSMRINEGKFMQVIDNLIRNSEYWVAREMQLKTIGQGEITMTVEAPFIRIQDNGPGVPLPVEESLFEPFVTTKPSNIGRGLGLFVVSQLLDSEGATVELGEHRNEAGRCDTFELDLRSLLAGGTSGAEDR